MLRRLTVDRIRCFEHLSLDFNAPQEGGDGWTILVGANGVGKSTLLQSVVLGLLDPRPITSLVPAPWRLFRSGADTAKPAVIAVELGSKQSVRFIHAAEGRYVDAGEDPISDSWGAHAQVPLLLAMAARRRIARPGELYEAENPFLERVQGMFETDHPLLTQDPFVALSTDSERREYARVSRDLVTHELGDGTRMFPLVDVVELRGKGGVTRNRHLLEGRRFVLRYGKEYSVRVAVEELSDGYQAMLALVLEILAQAAIHSRTVPDPRTLEAIVLIDEIEAHLHPRWQRTVVPLLRSAFPRCQFVATTHSPLVVGSALAGEVHVLEAGDDGDVCATVLEDRLAMLNADRIYEEVFGVDRMAPPELVERERDHLQRLASDGLEPDPELEAYVESAWQDAERALARDDPG